MKLSPKLLIPIGLGVSEPVLADPNPTDVLSVEPLFSEFAEVVHESTSGKGTVIFIRDMKHGEPGPEKFKLELVQKYLDIGAVGVEGWAGAEVDNERGHRFLNGEATLVQDLIDDPKWHVVPLEDPALQELGCASAYLGIWYYSEYKKQVVNRCLVRSSELSEISLEPDICMNVDDDFVQTLAKLQDSIKELYREVWPNLSSFEERVQRSAQLSGYADKNGQVQACTMTDCLSTQIQIMKGIFAVTVDERSRQASNRIGEYMETTGVTIFPFIYGDGHTEVIVDELKRQDFTIIVW